MLGLYKDSDMTAKMARYGVILLLGASCSTALQLTPAQEAGRLHREGKVVEAYAAYAAALCGEADDLEVARSFVEIWFELGQPGDPTARVVDCELTPGVLHYVRGLVAASQGSYEPADQQLAAALGFLGANYHGEVFYRRGLVALKAGQAEEALAFLNQAAGLSPERGDVRLALCQSKIELGLLPEAVEILRNLVTIKPNPRQVKRGRQLLETAVRAAEDPLPSEVETRLMESLSALDRSELNRAGFLELLALANEVVHPRVLTLAGIAALRFGADREGARLLMRAAELNPLDPDPPRALGVALLAAERPNEAFAPLRMALERDPLDRELARKLAKAAKVIGDQETARLSYRTLVALEPRITDNHLLLARVERELGNLNAARLAVNQAYALDAKSIPILLERAVINAKLAHSAPTQEERRYAAEMTRASVGELLEIAPDHPGATPILDSLDP